MKIGSSSTSVHYFILLTSEIAANVLLHKRQLRSDLMWQNVYVFLLQTDDTVKGKLRAPYCWVKKNILRTGRSLKRRPSGWERWRRAPAVLTQHVRLLKSTEQPGCIRRLHSSLPVSASATHTGQHSPSGIPVVLQSPTSSHTTSSQTTVPRSHIQTRHGSGFHIWLLEKTFPSSAQESLWERTAADIIRSFFQSTASQSC